MTDEPIRARDQRTLKSVPALVGKNRKVEQIIKYCCVPRITPYIRHERFTSILRYPRKTEYQVCENTASRKKLRDAV